MIPLAKPWFDKNEADIVSEVLQSGWVAGQGPMNLQLSNEVCEFVGSKYAIPVCNCTSGLHLALITLGIGKGDEVIVSDFSFPATAHAVIMCGATPRFVDVDLGTYNIKPDLIAQYINKKTRGIIVVHAFGHMAEIDRISRIAKENDLFVIEDAACAFGATYKNKKAGSYGDISAFSFHARKNITSGEGGIVVTDSEEWANKIDSLSCFGMESAFNRQKEFTIPSFVFEGFNYKLSDIQAAIAVEQIRKYPIIVKRKRDLVVWYNSFFSDNDLIEIPIEAENCQHVYQSYVVLLHKKIDRNKIIIALRNDGIQTQIGTYSLHCQPVYKSNDKCSNSLHLMDQTLALPLFYELKDAQVTYIAERLMCHLCNTLNHKRIE